MAWTREHKVYFSKINKEQNFCLLELHTIVSCNSFSWRRVSYFCPTRNLKFVLDSLSFCPSFRVRYPSVKMELWLLHCNSWSFAMTVKATLSLCVVNAWRHEASVGEYPRLDNSSPSIILPKLFLAYRTLSAISTEPSPKEPVTDISIPDVLGASDPRCQWGLIYANTIKAVG
jgi:hypothetical protein